MSPSSIVRSSIRQLYEQRIPQSTHLPSLVASAHAPRSDTAPYKSSCCVGDPTPGFTGLCVCVLPRTCLPSPPYALIVTGNNKSSFWGAGGRCGGCARACTRVCAPYTRTPQGAAVGRWPFFLRASSLRLSRRRRAPRIYWAKPQAPGTARPSCAACSSARPSTRPGPSQLTFECPL